MGAKTTRVNQIHHLGINLRKLEIQIFRRSPARGYNVDQFGRKKIAEKTIRSSP